MVCSLQVWHCRMRQARQTTRTRHRLPHKVSRSLSSSRRTHSPNPTPRDSSTPRRPHFHINYLTKYRAPSSSRRTHTTDHLDGQASQCLSTLADVQTQRPTILAPQGNPTSILAGHSPQIATISAPDLPLPSHEHHTRVAPPPRLPTHFWTRMARQEMM